MVKFYGFLPITAVVTSFALQMASSLLDVNPGGHLEAKNWFRNKLETVRNLKIGQILWFSTNNSCGDLICTTIMGSSIQMASSLLDVNPGSHLKATNFFKNELEAVRNPPPKKPYLNFFNDFLMIFISIKI